jgi:Protein kinase domain
MEAERKNLIRLTSPLHKNLVQIYSHGYLEYHLSANSRKRLPVYVMDMELGGESLHSWLKRRYHETGEGTRPVEVWEVLGQIASAVGWIHKRGVIHRDLKPENRTTPRPRFPQILRDLMGSNPVSTKPSRVEIDRLWHLRAHDGVFTFDPRKQRHR